MPLQAIAQLAMSNQLRLFTKTGWQISATKTPLNMLMLKNLPELVGTNTEWNA